MSADRQAESDALADLTDAEMVAVDQYMSEHMYRHQISNSYAGMSCDVHCRTQALGQAFRREVLTPRREACRPTPPASGGSR